MIAGTGFEKKKTNLPVVLEECGVVGPTMKSIDNTICISFMMVSGEVGPVVKSRCGEVGT